jgi:hypothetical protein
MADNQINIQSANIGLNLDSVIQQVQPGQLTMAMNANVENFDGNSVSYGNDTGNTKCVEFPEGFVSIGQWNIINLSRIIYWITNPSTGESQIGYSIENECIYIPILSDKLYNQNQLIIPGTLYSNGGKLNFSIHNPIKKAVVKTTNCSTQIYWTDGLNPRRYLDFEDLPWVEMPDPHNDYKKIKIDGLLDVNKLNVQPNFRVPKVRATEVVVGGELIMGTYQFAIQYANSRGEGYTSYYNVSNPVSIFEQKVGTTYNLPASKAIVLEINDLDTSGLYEYFNLAVVKTINNIPSVELVATLPITTNKAPIRYTYTGVEKSPIKLDIADILIKYPYYDTAGDIFEVDNILGWDILRQNEDINYQKIWSKVNLNWETYQIPYNTFEGYSNGANAANYRGYFRDEIYAFEGCFILKNGKQTRSFHIPGRIATNDDREVVGTSNLDNSFSTVNPCEDPKGKQKWRVYNTGSVTGFTTEYLNKKQDDDCYVGPFQYGQFGYWESGDGYNADSGDTYPNNEFIWGDLAGQKIRHHKFPDLLVTPIHSANRPKNGNLLESDSGTTFNQTNTYKIYPIGVKVDMGSLWDAINSSDLTQEEKDNIQGFKILRGNRAANKSIIAKGILHNVGESDYDGETYLYPNYPYNDLRPDPFYAKEKLRPVDNGETYRADKALQGFNEGAKSRFVFHSPDTHFDQPSISNAGEYLKLEQIIYGKSYGHFIPVKDNAEYKFLTRNTIQGAAAIAASSGFTLGAGQFGSPTFSSASVAPTYQSAMDMFEKLVPYTNFGYSFNSFGIYGDYAPIYNAGYKNRGITYNKYLNDTVEGVQDIDSNGNLVSKNINNYRRESSIYLKVNKNLEFTHNYDASIPIDDSRYLPESINSPHSEFLEEYWFYVEYPGINPAPPIGTAYQEFGTSNIFVVKSTNITSTINTIPNKSTGIIRTYLQNPGFTHPIVNPIGSLVIVPPITSALVPTTLTYSFSNPNTGFTDGGFHLVPNPDYLPIDIKSNLQTIQEKNISSYYGAIKRDIINQWGRVYSYETIDTGYYQDLYTLDNKPILNAPTVFGGDIYINLFGYKSKLPFFTNNTVSQPNQTDIAYDELGNINYPMFWLSTKPQSFDIDIDKGGALTTLTNDLFNPGGAFIVLNILTGAGLGVAHTNKFIANLFKQIYEKIGVKNINFDLSQRVGISEQGVMFLFAYGVPYFFCESEVNVDNRQATNEKEGNFFPNVSTNIPDDWFQEINVPIAYDNTYNYNQTYSKQNKENVYTHLREDYDPTKKCYTEFPNRAIYSDKSSLEETKNNWLVYRPAAYFDFPKSYGKMISIDNIEHRQLMVRFENNTQLYNALTTVQVSQGPDAYLGNTQLFSGSIPLDLSQSSVGYAGSQNTLFIKTEFGHIFVDAKRGQVIFLKGTNIEDLADKGMDKWFSKNLPFNILNFYPDVDIDNAQNGIGLTGTYDAFYKRIFITKLDYEPIYPDKTEYLGGLFYYDTGSENIQIRVGDPKYFIDKSWTLSYNFKTQSWVSFHSFTPNYYIAYPNYFHSGLNGDDPATWTHNRIFTLFNNYYGEECPYILEYPFVYKVKDEILQAVKDYTESRVYIDYDTFYIPDDIQYFDESVIYNNEQCTGVLKLIPKQYNNLSQYLQYPKYNTDNKEIIVVRSDNFYNYNYFWDIVKDKSKPFYTTPVTFKNDEKDLIVSNLDYSRRDFKKYPLRGKYSKLRHILKKTGVKLISKFVIQETVPSYK